MADRTLRLANFARTREALSYTAEIDGHRFESRFRYEGLDHEELERRLGPGVVESLTFHAIAFDLNRLVSLDPARVDFGPLAHHTTPAFRSLWGRIIDGVWGQWRYENDAPTWRSPEIVAAPAEERPLSIEQRGAADASPAPLLFFGGGKDSLLAAKLLEEAGQPFDSFAYSHSIYGDHGAQHDLIDRLLDRCNPRRRFRLRIDDDFAPTPELLTRFGVRSTTAAETPSSLFLALPPALTAGATSLVLAHERSADHGNLTWHGREINHQWGKSLEAEALLADYLERHLPGRLRYFSLLKPVRDPVIFAALRRHADSVPATHSCNRAKPWCRRCPKCLYVFLGCAGFLPAPTVLATFGENLFDVEANARGFAELLGLEGHLPFECVGQIDESRLFLHLAMARQWRGRILETLGPRLSLPPSTVIERLLEVRGQPHRIPERLAEAVLAQLETAASEARAVIRSHSASAEV